MKGKVFQVQKQQTRKIICLRVKIVALQYDYYQQLPEVNSRFRPKNQLLCNAFLLMTALNREEKGKSSVTALRYTIVLVTEKYLAQFSRSHQCTPL